jgi:predicted  nucleic acid-binding Zn-ribbon protein
LKIFERTETMNILKNVILCCLLILCPLAVFGCGKKADENKPISEVKAEAEKMDTDGLRAMAMAYKEAIATKKGDLEKLTAKLKDIPVTEVLGEEAKSLKADMENLEKSVSALKERFEVYYQKLKEQSGDLSGLQV